MEQFRKSSDRNVLNLKCFAMLQSEEYVDCTVVADGRFLKAHKLVLAASSEYFKEIFDIIPDKHPAIVLKDVKYTQLQHVIQYIYCGSVDIPPKEVEAFQSVLKSLKIVYEQDSPQISKPQSPPPVENVVTLEESSWAGVKVKDEPNEDLPFDITPEHDESMNGHSLVGILRSNLGLAVSSVTSEFSSRSNNVKNIPNSLPDTLTLRPVIGEGKISLERVVPSKKIQNFMASHPLLCPFCKKYFKTNKHRNEHVKYCFDNPDRIVSQCPLCDKSVCDPYYLRKHMRNVHGTTTNFPLEITSP